MSPFEMGFCHEASFSGDASIQLVVCIHCLFLWVQLGLVASLAVMSQSCKDLLCRGRHGFLLGALECVNGHKPFSLSKYALRNYCAPDTCKALGMPWPHEYSSRVGKQMGSAQEPMPMADWGQRRKEAAVCLTGAPLVRGRT